jgi:hypothetical protein
MRRLAALLTVLLAACAHNPPVEIPIEVPVPCLSAPVADPTPAADRVTDAQLKRAAPEKYPPLAGLRIEQDRKQIRVLRAAVDGCGRLPAPPSPP